MRKMDDESTLVAHNELIPIDEMCVIVDKEPNIALKNKIQSLHTPEMLANLKCVFDVWPQERLWINPLSVEMVDRIEISRDFPPSVQELLDKGAIDKALTHALTYTRMEATDSPARFIGAQRGNFVRVWKTRTRNSAPQFFVCI
jgi:hypothetical protein